MNIDFEKGSTIFKALSDETRVRIMHILSCGELCACEILKYFDLTQPTLSHHMAVLTVGGLVDSRKDGKWTYYRLNEKTGEFLTTFLDNIIHSSDECTCKKIQQSKKETQ